MGKNKRGRIGPNAEECRLSKGEDARIAPKDVDRQRHQRIVEGADQSVHHVGVENKRPRRDHDRECAQNDSKRAQALRAGARRWR